MTIKEKSTPFIYRVPTPTCVDPRQLGQTQALIAS